MKNYIALSIREALAADNGTPMRLTGTITSARAAVDALKAATGIVE